MRGISPGMMKRWIASIPAGTEAGKDAGDPFS